MKLVQSATSITAAVTGWFSQWLFAIRRDEKKQDNSLIVNPG